jgi:sulfhydrogenase subunit beta (sulfur reductase)
VRFIDRGGLDALLAELRDRGFELIGPTVRDGTIVLDRIDGSHDLPRGIGEAQEAGTYCLVDREDDRLFGFAHGPDSAKRFLFPAQETVAVAERSNGRLSVTGPDSEEPRYAFIGLRACDLAAIAIQDRVFAWDPSYRKRREGAFLVGVNCAEPGATCFCASTGSGPRCTEGFALVLTELETGFLVEAGSSQGSAVFDAIGSREATPEERSEAERISTEAAARMGRRLETDGLRELLYRNREHPEWSAVAEACLSCGNCTAVCPTCFCHDVVDSVDLSGERATRTREWASCLTPEFAHTAGGDVRPTASARYRQWATHKFAGWIDQFGTSGCVGCGRCITWCPAGIDIVRELEAIRATDGLREKVSA